MTRSVEVTPQGPVLHKSLNGQRLHPFKIRTQPPARLGDRPDWPVVIAEDRHKPTHVLADFTGQCVGAVPQQASETLEVKTGRVELVGLIQDVLVQPAAQVPQGFRGPRPLATLGLEVRPGRNDDAAGKLSR